MDTVTLRFRVFGEKRELDLSSIRIEGESEVLVLRRGATRETKGKRKALFIFARCALYAAESEKYAPGEEVAVLSGKLATTSRTYFSNLYSKETPGIMRQLFSYRDPVTGQVEFKRCSWLWIAKENGGKTASAWFRPNEARRNGFPEVQFVSEGTEELLDRSQIVAWMDRFKRELGIHKKCELRRKINALLRKGFAGVDLSTRIMCSF